MTLATVPDSERIVSDYLRTHADVIALNVRVVGKSPSNTATPWVRITELSAPQVNQPDHLVESLFQLDLYASTTGGQPEVNTLYRTVRAVLGVLPGAHSGGVVTGVQIIGSLRDLDTDFEPARDRRILTVLIWTHV